MTKQILLGRGRNSRPSILNDPGGRIFAAGDEAVPTATKRVNGRTYFFGAWRGETEGANYERWQRAAAWSDDIVSFREEVTKGTMFGEDGIKQQSRIAAGGFLVERTKMIREVKKEIDEVTVKGQALYDLDDWDITTPYHDRLVRQWRSMPEQEQSAMLRRKNEMLGDLVKALIREPEFTSGIDDETRVDLCESLLTDEQKETNEGYRAELAQLQAVAKSWDTASDLIFEVTQTTENELIEYLIIDDDDEDEPPPPEEGIYSLATGGIFKIDLTGDDDAEANAE